MSEPLPITKKLREIIDENPNVRVTGILYRTAQCVDMWVWPCDEYASLTMRWSEEWNAWSCRPAGGIYQQIIIFVPEDIDE